MKAEEHAQYNEWRDNNLNDLMLEYVKELPTKEEQFREFERLNDMYNSTYEVDEDFEAFIENEWSGRDENYHE